MASHPHTFRLGAVLVAVLFAGGCAGEPDPATKLKLAHEQAQQCANAFLKGDYHTFARMTYPTLAEKVGGVDALATLLRSKVREWKDKKIVLRKAQTDPPTQIVPGGSDLFTVVPYTLGLTAAGMKMNQKTYLIGVSSDRGRTWKFIEAGDSREKLLTFVPHLPDTLTIPEKETRVGED
jgi:hypothetical protein